MQPDELIDFHHLKLRKGMSQLELEDEVHSDLARATGARAGGLPLLCLFGMVSGWPGGVFYMFYVCEGLCRWITLTWVVLGGSATARRC